MNSWETKNGYKVLQILSGRSNVFLLTNGEKNILIDTSPKFMWNLLDKRLKTLRISILDLLLITHAHFDHAANSRRLKEKYKASVIVHQSEASYLASGQNTVTSGTNLLYKYISSHFAGSSFLNYEPCPYDLTVDTTFDLSSYGFNACILHTPGHTKGSMSLVVDDEIAIVGDCMFGVFKSSIFPPVAEDPDEMIRSWGKLLETNCSIFLPSHGSANDRSLVQREFDRRTGKLK
jgi:glyoxylase-like metal-dependent hydrolase (beta-lactamase superfamily II)